MVTPKPQPKVMLVNPPCTTSPGVPLPKSTTMATTPLPSRIKINVPRNSAASSARREVFCTRWAFYHPAIAFVVRALYGPLKRSEERRAGSEWSSDVCSSDLCAQELGCQFREERGFLHAMGILPSCYRLCRARAIRATEARARHPRRRGADARARSPASATAAPHGRWKLRLVNCKTG